MKSLEVGKSFDRQAMLVFFTLDIVAREQGSKRLSGSLFFRI
jgi:hypothetical protein